MAQGILTLMQCVTPLHTGSGDGLGFIDRPLIRERQTGYPYVTAKSLKGALRARAEAQWNDGEKVNRMFGAPGTDGSQGALSVGDANLLLFPVRAMAGTYALVTTRPVLARFRRLLEMSGWSDQMSQANGSLIEAVSSLLAASRALDTNADDAIVVQDTVNLSTVGGKQLLVLENVVLNSIANEKAKSAASQFADAVARLLYGEEEDRADERAELSQHVVIVSTDVFDDLVKTATVVEPAIKIGENGVTEKGSLRYSEYLPTETVLYSVCIANDGDTDDAVSLIQGGMQIGGDESAGRGLVLTAASRGE